MFSVQRYDPFSFAYPGYVTIRRFADLTDPYLAGVRHAVDFGCGPGEITCALARRHPEIRFAGVDHSAAAYFSQLGEDNARAHGNPDAHRADFGEKQPHVMAVVWSSAVL